MKILHSQGVKSLVLRAPAAYTDAMMGMTYKERMEIEKAAFQILPDFNSALAFRTIASFIVPLKMSHAYLDNAKLAKQKSITIIKDATHNLSQDKWRVEFKNQAVSWFIKTL